MVTEGLASTLGIDRRSVDKVLQDVRDAVGSRGAEINRRIVAIYSGDASPDAKFDAVVTYTEASVLNDNAVRNRLMASLGVALVGGLTLTLGTVLAYIVGVILILIALMMAMEPAKQALQQLKARIDEISIF